MIEFNNPPHMEKSITYMKQAMENNHICGDGYYTKKCSEWITKKTGISKALLTTSCTHALEMAAMMMDIKAGDEVIMPAYTFASTADAFALRGAQIIFVDIKPETMNINEELIEQAITNRTKAIVPVHYAGVSCEMDKIMDIAKSYNLFVAEDAAQGVMSAYKGKALGSIGNFGCYSFHETKNYSMGEGGAFLIRDSNLIEKAEILREKGTNRSKFWRGEIDKYTWVDLGSSYLPSELNTAYLWAQLEHAESINERRLEIWDYYNNSLQKLKHSGYIKLPYIPSYCKHNAHMYYIKTRTGEERNQLITYLKQNGIHAVFHYIPLHKVPAGLKYGSFYGEDQYTTSESEKLVRLPLFYGLRDEEAAMVVKRLYEFYSEQE